MNTIAESELILNERGAVYHLNLRPEELAATIFTVGDPGRVALVSRHFDQIEFQTSHREFITHTGYIGATRLTVMSSGIGTDNIDIVLNELDALANIDLTTRTVKPTPTALNIIRIGTCGSLQPKTPVDAFVASTHGLGIDNLLHFYRHTTNDDEQQILQAFIAQTQLQQAYITGASSSLLKHFVNGFHHGITVSCPGFYGPQGRTLRAALTIPDLVDRLSAFRLGNHSILNFEMETSAIYGLGRILGHRCLSLNTVVANRVTRQFSKNAAAAIDRLIITALEGVAGARLS